MTFTGFGGHPIKALADAPAAAVGPGAGVVEYIGYGGGRGLRARAAAWASAGFAHFVMDNRGQGSTGPPAATPPDPGGTGPH